MVIKFCTNLERSAMDTLAMKRNKIKSKLIDTEKKKGETGEEQRQEHAPHSL
jgi:hypothetical protein